jgi:hypothetical protein
MGLVGRTIRTVTLDEVSGPKRDEQGAGAPVVAALSERVEQRRPILAQFLRSAYREIAPFVDQAVQSFRAMSGGVGHRAREAADLELAIAAVVLLISIADDIGDEAIDSHGGVVDESSVWAVNAAALGISDLLVAELFEILADVSADNSRAVVDATRTLLAHLTARSVSERRHHLDIEDVLEMVRKLAGDLQGRRSHAA